MKQLNLITEKLKKALCPIRSISARLSRLRSICLGLISLGLISLSSVLSAASLSDLTFTLINEGKEYAVTDFDLRATGSLTIPATYQGLPVTEIGEAAFLSANLTEVELSEGLRTIRKEAFRNAPIETINLPSSLRTIGEAAFLGTDLLSISLPTSLTALGNYAFQDSTSLAGSVTIPSAITEIPIRLFGNTALTEVIFHDAVTSIGGWAFENTALKSLRLPAGLTDLGRAAFSGCRSLAGSVTIPSGVTVLSEDLFSRCTALTEVILHEGVIAINRGVFFSSSIERIDLPASLTYLGDSVFANCASLTGTVTIPSGVTSISPLLFYGTPVTEVVLHDGVTSIGHYAFIETDLRSIRLPESLSSIGAQVFEYAYNLAEVRLEGAAPSLGGYSFKDAGRDVAGGTRFYIEYEHQASYENSADWSGFTFTVLGDPNAPLIEAFVLSTSLNASGTVFSIHSHGEPSDASASVLVQHRSSLKQGEWTAVASADVTESRDSESGVVTRSVSLSSSPASEGFYRLHYEGSASGGAE